MRALSAALASAEEGEAALVVSNVPDAGGIAWAKAQGIATCVVDHRDFGKDRLAFEAALAEALTPHALDMICLAGFMRVLSAGFVTPWQGRMLNIHPSLLPKYKGLHTHLRALDAGPPPPRGPRGLASLTETFRPPIPAPFRFSIASLA